MKLSALMKFLAQHEDLAKGVWKDRKRFGDTGNVAKGLNKLGDLEKKIWDGKVQLHQNDFPTGNAAVSDWDSQYKELKKKLYYGN